MNEASFPEGVPSFGEILVTVQRLSEMPVEVNDQHFSFGAFPKERVFLSADEFGSKVGLMHNPGEAPALYMLLLYSLKELGGALRAEPPRITMPVTKDMADIINEYNRSVVKKFGALLMAVFICTALVITVVVVGVAYLFWRWL